jgi:hypothetical protein
MGHEEGGEGRGRAGAHGPASSSPDKGLDPMDGPPSMCYSATRAGPGPAQLSTRSVGPGVQPPHGERERERERERETSCGSWEPGDGAVKKNCTTYNYSAFFYSSNFLERWR